MIEADDDYVSVSFTPVKKIRVMPADIGEWPSYAERVELGDTDVL